MSIDSERIELAVRLLGPRLVTAGDIILYPYLFTEDYPLDTIFTDVEQEILCGWRDVICFCDNFESASKLTEETWGFAVDWKLNRRKLAALIRTALTGTSQGPGLFELLLFLGKRRVDRRINRALGFDNAVLDLLLQFGKRNFETLF